MDTSPITAWTHVSAYFTFANHESGVIAILLLSIVLTVLVIADIMRHEKHSEGKVMSGQVVTSSAEGSES